MAQFDSGGDNTPNVNNRDSFEWVARQRLAPARACYKEGRYRDARAELAGLDEEARGTPLCASFDAYLARLEARRGGRPAEVPPEGPVEDVERLHFYLVGEELARVRQLYDESRHDEARDLAEAALAQAPHFPYLHFLLALSLYSGLRARLEADNAPGLDDMAAVLGAARRHAEAAVADPELTGAPGLVSAIGRLADRVADARREQDLARADAELFDPCVDAYKAILKSAEGGVGSPAQHRELSRRLTDLQGRVADVSGRLRSEEGREHCRNLSEAIAGALGRLAEIGQGMAEAEAVQALYRQFDAEVGAVKGGVRAADRLAVAERFADLFLRAAGERRALRAPAAREAVERLLDALRDILRQLDASDLLTRPPAEVSSSALFRRLIGE
jgi:hypothetical protein